MAETRDRREYQRAYYLANRERIIAAQKRYQQSPYGRERHNARAREWAAKNRESHNAYNKAYYESHKEERAAYAKAYHAAHREEINAKSRERYRQKKLQMLMEVKEGAAQCIERLCPAHAAERPQS